MSQPDVASPGVVRPELWLVRHGETEWSRDHKHTGRSDIALTPQGEADARRLGERLNGVHFDLVLSSPRRRALDTARLAGFPDAEVEPAAVEWDYGEYEGLTTAQIRRTVPGWSVWTHGVPAGETPGQVAARADSLIQRVRGAGSRVLLFAHAHFLRVLGVRWIGGPASTGAHLRLATATISILGWERETPAIDRWNT